MELELSDDQKLFRETTAAFIAGRSPLSEVRRVMERPEGVDDRYLRAVGELGWFSMLVPERHGGGSVSGAGVLDLAIIAEERGRGLQLGPFLTTNLVADAVASAGTPAQQAILAELVSGARTATWVGSDVTTGPRDPGIGVSAEPTQNGWSLSGASSLVAEAARSDLFLVTARAGDDLRQFLVPADAAGIGVTPVAAMDLSQRLATVTFDGVLVPDSAVLGAVDRTEEQIERQLQIALVLSTTDSVGAMDALFALTCQYAKDRVAFGRPIGGFQAIKHQLADLSLGLECSKAVAAAAARAVQSHEPDAGEVASIAKSWIGEAGIELAQGCFQIFAGIGFTWEHDLHLFLRRITMNGLLFGDPDWHRERICGLHEIGASCAPIRTT